jgi:NCS2 family nucleobase:cation symporter-2
MRKPSNLIFGVDQVPPLGVTVLSGLQQAGVLSITLVLPLLVFRAAGLEGDSLRNALSVSMLVLAVGALLPALRWGPVGAGYLCPSNFSAFYLSSSLLAVKVGGLPLVFGMTVFAGLVEAAAAALYRQLRAFLPSEVSGLIVVLLSVNLGGIGMRLILEGMGTQSSGALDAAIVALTLGTMVAISIWGGRSLGMFSALAGMFVGYMAAAFAGLLSGSDVARIASSPVLAIPSLGHVAWSFDATLAAAFGVAALGACLKSIGVITTCQKINDADWVRPDDRSASRGVLADALGTVCGGLLGTSGVNSAPSCVGIATASGVTSRVVAYATAAALVVGAFLPQIATILAVMPEPVMGATLLFASCYIFVNGLSIIASRLFDARRTAVIGLSFMVGMAADLFPGYFAGFPASIQPLVSSSLVVGVTCALLLNAAFRLGMRHTARLSVDPERPDPKLIEDFMETQGASWGARRDVIERARFNLAQSVETIIAGCNPQGPLDIEAVFDEFNLDVRVSYPGAPLVLPAARPTNEEIIASEAGERGLAGFLLRRLADRVNASHHAGRSTLLFHFDH